MTYTNAQVLDSVKRCSDWIKKNKKNPLTVRVNKDVLPINDWKKLHQIVDAKNRVDKYIKEHKSFPNYVLILNFKFMKAEYKILWGMVEQSSKTTTTLSKSTTRFVSSPHLTTYGSGLGQDTGYYCACNSLQQAFYKLTGKKVDEKTIAGWAGTTTQGTGHSGIDTAVAAFNRKYGTKLKITWKNFSDFGSSDKARFKAIGELINKSNTAVFFHIGYHNGGDNLSGKSFGHYEMCDIININTSYVRALNSLGGKCSGAKYCGFLQDRKFSIQKGFIQGISQKSVCIITK